MGIKCPVVEEIDRRDRIGLETPDREGGAFLCYLPPEGQVCTAPIRKRCIPYRLEYRNVLACCLCHLHHKVVQFNFLKDDTGLYRAVYPVVDVDRGIRSVAGDILKIRIFHQDIYLAVSCVLFQKVIEQLLFQEIIYIQVIDINDHRKPVPQVFFPVFIFNDHDL